MANILVVEDELLLRDVLFETLTGRGYSVSMAGDAEKAMSLAKEVQPDVALIDIQLPKESGLSLTIRLKELYPSLSIIIMTGFPSLDSAVNALKNGASEYIIKPFRLVELNNTIKKYLSAENAL